MIVGAGYVGDARPGAVLAVPFSTLAADGGPWPLAGAGFLVRVVRPDGGSTESGVAVVPDQPVYPPEGGGPVPTPGHHLILIDTGADAFYAAGSDYRVAFYGDPVGGAAAQGVTVGHFSLGNRGG